MKLAPHIESVEGVCGGDPVIEGTRITVDLIWQWFFRNHRTVEQILIDYPHLTRAQVTAAVKYGKEHPEIISASVDE